MRSKPKYQSPQATRYTPQELAMLNYWEGRGYRFSPGERPPLSTVTPPRPSGLPPLADFLLGSSLIIITLLMLGAWMYTGAHWAWSRP